MDDPTRAADEDARKAAGISRANWPEYKRRQRWRVAYGLPPTTEADHRAAARALDHLAVGGYPDDADLAAYLRVSAEPGLGADDGPDGALIPAGLLRYLAARLEGTVPKPTNRPKKPLSERAQAEKAREDVVDRVNWWHRRLSTLRSQRKSNQWPIELELPEPSPGHRMPAPRWRGDRLRDPLTLAIQIVAAAIGNQEQTVRDWRKNVHARRRKLRAREERFRTDVAAKSAIVRRALRECRPIREVMQESDRGS